VPEECSWGDCVTAPDLEARGNLAAGNAQINEPTARLIPLRKALASALLDGPVIRRGTTDLQMYFDGTRWWGLGWLDVPIESE